ncbi:hypothetical protein Tco_0918800 [Tanacetum coccineum]
MGPTYHKGRTNHKREGGPILIVGVINNPLKSKEPPKIMSIKEMIFPPIRNKAPSVDPILISVQVYERQVGRVLVNGGAACDIIYEHCFLKLHKEVRERRKDVYATLSGFSGEQINPLGEVSLLKTVREAPHHRCEQVKRLKESLSEAPLEVSECINPKEKVIVNHRYPEQTVTIRRQLPTQFKQKLVKLLRSNADIFAWEYSDMTRIPRTLKIGSEIFVVKHKLNEDKRSHLCNKRKERWPPSEVLQHPRKWKN